MKQKNRFMLAFLIVTTTMVSMTSLYGQSKKGKNYETVVSGSFEVIREFSDGLAFTSLYHAEEPSFMEFGFIDKTGKFVVHTYTEAAQDFSEGLAAVMDYHNYKWGYYDKSEKWAIPAVFEFAGPFSEGLAAVAIDGKYGFIDKNGEIVIPATFDGAGPFQKA